MAKHHPFDDPTLQKLCEVLGDTDSGLTGTEIGRLLLQCAIPDPASGTTKRYRLYEALKAKQCADGCANNVLHFIRTAMSPVSYIGKKIALKPAVPS